MLPCCRSDGSSSLKLSQLLRTALSQVEGLLGNPAEGDTVILVKHKSVVARGALSSVVRVLASFVVENTLTNCVQHISTVTLGADSSVGEVLAEGVSLSADSFLVEERSGSALETDLVVPVPFSTESVGNGLEFSRHAESLAQNESLVALLANSVGVSSLAEIVNGDTDTLLVREPSLRASQADLVVPVPLSTAKIRGALKVKRVQNTEVIGRQDVTLIAGGTDSSVGEGLAVVIDGSTDSSSVEHKSLRASQTDLVEPVPFGTASIGWLDRVKN